MTKRRQAICQWFARCSRPATTTRPGPILQPAPHWGDIPVCTKCAALIDQTNPTAK